MFSYKSTQIFNFPVYRNDGTNIFLERYNRHFNGIFDAPHPSLPKFATALQAETNRLIAHKRRVESGFEEPPARDPIEWPSIPDEYKEFCPFTAHYLITSTSGQEHKVSHQEG